jgi:hypothetical protein
MAKAFDAVLMAWIKFTAIANSEIESANNQRVNVVFHSCTRLQIATDWSSAFTCRVHGRDLGPVEPTLVNPNASLKWRIIRLPACMAIISANQRDAEVPYLENDVIFNIRLI